MTQADLPTTEVLSSRQAIADTASRLQSLTQRSHQPYWHFSQAPLQPSQVVAHQDWHQWAIAPLNEKDHIAWPRGKQPLWLCQEIIVPTALHDFPLAGLSLRLGLTWWADTVHIYVNGKLVQAGDLFDYFARIQLSNRVTPGDRFVVAIHLLSPGHDEGALVRSDAIYQATDLATPDPGFVADELAVLSTYAEQLAPDQLATIATAIAPLDWSQVSQSAAFQAELAALRDRLSPYSGWIKQRQIACVGHAHLDLAWLWPIAETWQAAERTFRSVLALQTDFPELTYTHSSPALFDWLETHQPELFEEIRLAVKAGSWTIDAGLWVEPELNTLGGESLARQILYGQRYTRSRFGQESAIAWLPDSFGFSWQLPQLLKLGKIDYFATQKLRWNETTRFPHSLFWWQGLDGTAILSLTLPPIGTDIDPTQMARHSAEWEAQTGLTEMLWLPGMGDHGGGPTRDMLESARRWSTSPFFPQLKFTHPLEHLQGLTTCLQSSAHVPQPHAAAEPTSPRIPVWNDELYLELHRGCYTVHADQKWYNRRCEDTLREAELFAAIAHLQGHFPYPQATLEQAWKRVLFNQFHDILPGTAIPEVFATANPEWQWAYDTAKTIREEALGAIARQLSWLPSPPANAVSIILFNSLNWEHTEVVEVPLTDLPIAANTWRVFDPQSGSHVVTQISHHTDHSETPPSHAFPEVSVSPRLLFLATVPPVGYRLYWLLPDIPTSPQSHPSIPNRPFILQNELIRAVVDATTGELVELWELGTQRQVVRSPANQLQAFRDAGQYWDAWDIAPNYQDQPLPRAELTAIEWLETGPLRQRLRVVRRIADSTLQQDYVLDQRSPYLRVATVADWHPTQVVLKTAFPLSFTTDQATYEIPFGAIARPTHSTDPHQQAKWEVPAYRWADMHNGERGMSILTDYKHGFDAQPDQLRLTLLKAPLWPDPHADRGRHQFTYALYPHAGDWQSARTPHWAIAFNTPLQWVLGTSPSPDQAIVHPYDQHSTVSSAGTFLDWQTAGIHLAALKLAEDEANHYILRFWEMYGEGATVDVGNSTIERTNLLEAAIAVPDVHHLAPWQIATFKTPAFFNKSLNKAHLSSHPD